MPHPDPHPSSQQKLTESHLQELDQAVKTSSTIEINPNFRDVLQYRLDTMRAINHTLSRQHVGEGREKLSIEDMRKKMEVRYNIVILEQLLGQGVVDVQSVAEHIYQHDKIFQPALLANAWIFVTMRNDGC